MTASFPTSIKNFGTDHINGDILVPGDVNDLRAEMVAVQAMNSYQIVPSIASNNLTVAIKALSGGDPSATEPIGFMIAGAGHLLTGALSVTVNAGTSIFNAGSSEIKTNDIDLFVYIGWRVGAPSTLFTLISRIPYARTYADFSGTSTSDRYGAYSGSAPSSTDVVRVIGRFAAQNSGSASFNWSIPTPFVIHEPVFETRWQNWVPTFVGFSANPASSVNRYQIVGKLMNIEVMQPNAGTSNATNFTMSAPMTSFTLTNGNWNVMSAIVDSGSILTTPGFISILSNSNTITIFKDAAGTNWTASGGKRVTAYRLFCPLAS